MIESLRARLLLGHTATLTIVMVVIGIVACYASWRSELASVDAALAARADSLARALHPQPSGAVDVDLPPAPPGIGDEPAPYYALWNATGETIDRSDPDWPVARPTEAGVRTIDGRREVVVRAASGALVLVGRDLADARRQIWTLAGVMVAIGGVALVLSLAGGWWLVNRALAPVEGIGRTARAMVDGDFGARIATDRFETEFRQLAQALNEAFDRMHASLEGQRRFTADASHELRTPLATLSTEVQWAIGRPRTPDQLRESLVVVARAAGRMQGVVERMLALARADAAVDRDERGPVHVADLMQSVIDDLTPLSAHRRVLLQLTAPPGLVVHGDAARLTDALTNVVANAIQYGPAGSPVAVTADGDSESVLITVQDAGPGIAAADPARVFEPFFRADPARSRDAGGAGLGLTLTRAIVESHGGTVTCSSAPGQGTTVTMRLPRQT